MIGRASVADVAAALNRGDIVPAVPLRLSDLDGGMAAWRASGMQVRTGIDTGVHA